MGGRVDDIEAVESDPFTVYVGFATGGLWKTTNNGTTWTPLFDEQAVSSIGDIAIAPSNPSVVYVGTGEPNNRQSSTIGNGMYKSTDAGKTWTHIGLADTQSIGRIVVDPKDPNIGVRRGRRTSVWTEQGTRTLQDQRWRRHVDEHEVHR